MPGPTRRIAVCCDRPHSAMGLCAYHYVRTPERKAAALRAAQAYQARNPTATRDRRRRWREANRELSRELDRKHDERTTKAFHEYKLSLGCARCGYKGYAGSLDFHHLNPATKLFCVTKDQWAMKPTRAMEEIKKCILLCKNCHYEEHARLRGKY